MQPWEKDFRRKWRKADICGFEDLSLYSGSGLLPWVLTRGVPWQIKQIYKFY
jgi:hypothetical protein